MITQKTLIYSIEAAKRILNIKSGVYEVQEWAWVIWVRGTGFCRFMSKKVFQKHFADRRKEAGKSIFVSVDTHDNSHFIAQGSKDFYELFTHDSSVSCNCEDFKNQMRFIGKGVCKHGYAVLNFLGFGSLAEYVDRDRSYEKVPSLQIPCYIPPKGERTSRNRSID